MAAVEARSLGGVGSYDADHWTQWAPTDANLAAYLAGNARPYNATKGVLLERLIGPATLAGQRVLDYGGGAGYFGLCCARRGAHITLVDPQAPALKMAQRVAELWGVRERLQVIHSDTVPTALQGQAFDLVIAKDVVEHVVDHDRLMQDLAACQRPGGRLLLSTQSSWSLNYVIEGAYRRWWCGEPDWCGWDPTHVRFYTPRTLSALMRRAGYAPQRWAGLYLVPYDLPSWLTLLRVQATWSWLQYVDRAVGTWFPFNRLGWNVLVLAERQAERR